MADNPIRLWTLKEAPQHSKDLYRYPTREEWAQYGIEQGFVKYLDGAEAQWRLHGSAGERCGTMYVEEATFVVDAALGVSDE